MAFNFQCIRINKVKPSAHLHLLINAEIYDPPGPNDCEKISAIMNGLVSHVRMKVMLDPVTAWCNDPGNEGITSTVILTTSHSALHIWNLPPPQPSVMQFDLYSCGHFDPIDVIKFISMTFKVTNAAYKFLDRDSDLIELAAGNYAGNMP